MLDADLAKLYGVETKVLLQAVKRNSDRFPADFMFQLTNQEVIILRSQTVTSSLASHADLPRKLNDLEKKYDTQFKIVFDAIRQVMASPVTKKRKIGFKGE